MHLELTMEQAQALETLLEKSLKELSHEIAATDNAGYRAELSGYRDRLAQAKEVLGQSLTGPPGVLSTAPGFVRELAHPGD